MCLHGCITQVESLMLVVEFVRHGNLLNYFRNWIEVFNNNYLSQAFNNCTVLYVSGRKEQQHTVAIYPYFVCTYTVIFSIIMNYCRIYTEYTVIWNTVIMNHRNYWELILNWIQWKNLRWWISPSYTYLILRGRLQLEWWVADKLWSLTK